MSLVVALVLVLVLAQVQVRVDAMQKAMIYVRIIEEIMWVLV